MKRKFTCLFLICAILLLAINLKAANTTKYYSNDGKKLEKAGIIEGDNKNDLMLGDTLQRQDLVIIMARLLSEEKRAKNSTGKLEFKDVEPNRYYTPFIIWAVEKGIISGKSEKEFGVGDDVTLIQLETILLRILGYEEEAKNSSIVPTLSNSLGITDGIFSRSDDSISRGELSRMIINALNTERKGSTLKLKEVLYIDIK